MTRRPLSDNVYNCAPYNCRYALCASTNTVNISIFSTTQNQGTIDVLCSTPLLSPPLSQAHTMPPSLPAKSSTILHFISSSPSLGSTGVEKSLRWNFRLTPRALFSLAGGEKIRHPWSSMRMKRRFQRRDSGNWTFTSPMSTTWRRDSETDTLRGDGVGSWDSWIVAGWFFRSTCEVEDADLGGPAVFGRERMAVRLDIRFNMRPAREALPPLPSLSREEVEDADLGRYLRPCPVMESLLAKESEVWRRWEENEKRPRSRSGLRDESAVVMSRCTGASPCRSCSTISGLWNKPSSLGSICGFCISS
jgi:hypothetical protein